MMKTDVIYPDSCSHLMAPFICLAKDESFNFLNKIEFKIFNNELRLVQLLLQMSTLHSNVSEDDKYISPESKNIYDINGFLIETFEWSKLQPTRNEKGRLVYPDSKLVIYNREKDVRKFEQPKDGKERVVEFIKYVTVDGEIRIWYGYLLVTTHRSIAFEISDTCECCETWGIDDLFYADVGDVVEQVKWLKSWVSGNTTYDEINIITISKHYNEYINIPKYEACEDNKITAYCEANHPNYLHRVRLHKGLDFKVDEVSMGSTGIC
jgi:hypothetical protein